MMHEQFISEKICPVPSTLDTMRMAGGQPGLPQQFLWRNQTISVKKVLRCWRETGPCRHGSGERYLRKYWYEVQTDAGAVMKIYFLKPTKGNLKDAGWRIFSVRQ